jgi:hypothetical protein
VDCSLRKAFWKQYSNSQSSFFDRKCPQVNIGDGSWLLLEGSIALDTPERIIGTPPGFWLRGEWSCLWGCPIQEKYMWGHPIHYGGPSTQRIMDGYTAHMGQCIEHMHECCKRHCFSGLNLLWMVNRSSSSVEKLDPIQVLPRTSVLQHQRWHP